MTQGAGGMLARVIFSVLLSFLGCSSAVAETDGDLVKPSSVAGSWYPDDESWLSANIDRLLAEAVPDPRLNGNGLRALIVPHAGYQYSGAVAAAGFKLVQSQAYDRVVVLGPAHAGGFRGIWLPTETHFSTPLGKIPVDREAVSALNGHPLVHVENSGPREHSVEMELPFLQRALEPGWKLLPILVGWMDDDDYPLLAERLRSLLDDSTLVVVSSDFTHYGPRYRYLPFPAGAEVAAQLRRLDMGAFERIADLDPDGFAGYRDETGITACGFGPIRLLLHLLAPGTRVELVRYTTSGELTGDYLNSVSYLTVAFFDPAKRVEASGGLDQPLVVADGEGTTEEPESDRDMLLLHRLARLAVVASVGHDEEARQILMAETTGLPESLTRPSGAFVTLRRAGELRGCIGYVGPREPLFRAVIQNGVNAALFDDRFPPVQSSELEGLDLEVSVLSEPQSIASYADYQVEHEGIILHKDGRSAVFLPEVATQQGWDREQTLSQLARKAGLAPDAWREGASFEVFTTRSYTAPVLSRVP